ncbi:hypothetical protein M422DRAFT_57629 [Sphaerobolus stellatus SS14]|nr:hypothetical protein M422DRAFT_57629 [Sphaerobolus stellatus SS14]
MVVKLPSLSLAPLASYTIQLLSVPVTHYLATIFSCLILRIIYLLYFHPLSSIPGPRLAAITDLWKAFKIYKKQMHSDLQQLHATYGDLVRIGPNEVSIVSPTDVGEIYGPKSAYIKGPFYRAWQAFGNGHFSRIDPVSHRTGRQAVARAYSLSHVISLERYCEATTKALLQVFDGFSAENEQIDMSKVIEAYAYDTVSGIGFGKNFDMGVAVHQITIWGAFSNWNWMLTTRPFSQIIQYLLGNGGPSLFAQYGNRYIQERIAQRENDKTAYDAEEAKDLLHWFLEASPNFPELFDNYVSHASQVDDTTLTLFSVAGADTTKSAMLGFIRYVYSDPSTLHRLRSELDPLLSQRPTETQPLLSYSEVVRLEYLWACIRESLRLHPTIGLPLQRVVPKGGRNIAGRFFPEGTLVGMQPRLVHTDPRAYGDDAASWRPERWLEEDRNQLEMYNLAFGHGTRVCLGKNISLMEMATLLPLIVYYYDIEMRGPDSTPDETAHEGNNVKSAEPWQLEESWFLGQNNFWCTVKKRERVV